MPPELFKSEIQKPIHEYKLIAIMYDGSVVEQDCTPNNANPVHQMFWFDSYETVQMANFVVCIRLDTGRTEVIKNRWGDTGDVYTGG